MNHSYRMTPKIIVLVILCVLGLASVALYAQQTFADVDNPTAIVFTPSSDHAVIDGYEADILRPDGTVLQVLNLGKPAPDATNLITANINVQPIAFATGYTVRVRAKAGVTVSVDANSLNKFNRRPGGPGSIRVK